MCLRAISFSLTLSLILTFFMPLQTARAGWGDLMKKLEDKAPELLQQQDESTVTQLDTDTLIRGLKQALEVSTQRAVEQVSKSDGYFGNPRIKVPLPTVLSSGAELVRKFGGDSLVDDFELSMNRAAEKAAPKATEYLLETLRKMSFEDAQKIYQGNDDAATRYFQENTSALLEKAFKPIIQDTMKQVGVTGYYQALVKQASQYPLVGDMDLNLENHVTKKSLQGLFLILAEQEKRIRKDPIARSTDLLKQVFGQ